MTSAFINESFDNAIKTYILKKSEPWSKEYNSFLVVMIRMLVNIYGELDILNPYYSLNEMAIKDNLKKYGANDNQVDNLFFMFDMYSNIEKSGETGKGKNSYFILLQKLMIDLFVLKKQDGNLVDSDYKEFFDLLYTPVTSDPLRQSFNYLNSVDIYEVAKYYQEEINKAVPIIKQENKELLDLNIYKLFNFKLADISKMNNDEVKEVNKEIYSYFNIDDNTMNKKYLLDNEIKKLLYERNKVTTGNGYVDILLIMSVIVTTIMIITIFVSVIV